MHLRWSKEDARLYQLYALRLHGRAYPPRDEGIRECFFELGALQLDPLPVLGRNHDLVVQARVDDTYPGDALDLIHRERLGFEYWDKALCAVPVPHFPMFRAFMDAGGEAWERRREEALHRDFPGAIEAVYEAVKEHGPLSSRELKDVEIAQDERRGWKATRVANVALEALWNRGRISVSHRVHFRKYYDLTERVIPKEHWESEPPSWDELSGQWLRKRVRDVGLLSLRGDAEAWALLREVRANELAEELVERGELALVSVEGVRGTFLALPDAQELLEAARSAPFDGRVRFLAPLDPLLWGRKALAQIWDFEYAWEVYKPEHKRRWGYYVLPVLYGDRFVARFDGKYDLKSGTLTVSAYYEEPGGLPPTHTAVEAAFQRFLEYLGGERIVFKPSKRAGAP